MQQCGNPDGVVAEPWRGHAAAGLSELDRSPGAKHGVEVRREDRCRSIARAEPGDHVRGLIDPGLQPGLAEELSDELAAVALGERWRGNRADPASVGEQPLRGGAEPVMRRSRPGEGCSRPGEHSV